MGFNPRTPAGCDFSLSILTYQDCRCFNPRTPAGCDQRLRLGEAITITVSIHAPLRGATGPISLFKQGKQVSIHAPLRGATGREGRLCTT